MSLNGDGININVEYGKCSKCGQKLEPIFSIIEEVCYTNDGYEFKTGRKKTICNFLFCNNCGCRETIDDTFDGKWW